MATLRNSRPGKKDGEYQYLTPLNKKLTKESIVVSKSKVLKYIVLKMLILDEVMSRKILPRRLTGTSFKI
jgi:hypothetical protein